MVSTQFLMMCGATLWMLYALTGCQRDMPPPDPGDLVDASESLESVPAAPAPVENPVAPGIPPTPVMVEVQGAIVLPGHYALPDDARVFDALEKAGGTTEQADITDINIAARLIDGSVLSIPYQPSGDGAPSLTADLLNPPEYTRSGWEGRDSAGAGATSGQAASTPSIVDLNTASREQLETLPGVGPKTADKIIAFRSQQPFASVEDLRHVPGIGEKRLESLRPLVTVHH